MISPIRVGRDGLGRRSANDTRRANDRRKAMEAASQIVEALRPCASGGFSNVPLNSLLYVIVIEGRDQSHEIVCLIARQRARNYLLNQENQTTKNH